MRKRSLISRCPTYIYIYIYIDSLTGLHKYTYNIPLYVGSKVSVTICEIIGDSGEHPVGKQVPRMVRITLNAEPEYGISAIRKINMHHSTLNFDANVHHWLRISHQYTAHRPFLISSQLPPRSSMSDQNFVYIPDIYHDSK